MIALDTNLLLRYVVEDHAAQTEQARAFIENTLSGETPGFVSLVVVCELVWSLMRSYGRTRAEVVNILAAFLDVGQLQMEAPDILRRALAATDADIADALIHEIGQAYGCSKTITFDRRFARLVGVERLR